MNWYYWICHSGPGHQSTSDGFFEAEDDERAEEIIEYKADDRHDPIFHYWKVDKLPASMLASRIESIRKQIEALNTSLIRLSEQPSGEDASEEGRNEEVVEALQRTIDNSVLSNLHKKGIVISQNTLRKWYMGEAKPKKLFLRKAINAIKKAKKYPKYQNG
jgi:hypothetical protein